MREELRRTLGECPDNDEVGDHRPKNPASTQFSDQLREFRQAPAHVKKPAPRPERIEYNLTAIGGAPPDEFKALPVTGSMVTGEQAPIGRRSRNP